MLGRFVAASLQCREIDGPDIQVHNRVHALSIRVVENGIYQRVRKPVTFPSPAPLPSGSFPVSDWRHNVPQHQIKACQFVGRLFVFWMELRPMFGLSRWWLLNDKWPETGHFRFELSEARF